MPQLSRSQVVVYGAVAIALLLVGARAIRAEGDAGTPAAAAAQLTATPAPTATTSSATHAATTHGQRRRPRAGAAVC